MTDREDMVRFRLEMIQTRVSDLDAMLGFK